MPRGGQNSPLGCLFSSLVDIVRLSKAMTLIGKAPLNGLLRWILGTVVLIAAVLPIRAVADARHYRIVLIAGSKSHGPGMHEYLKSARLIKVLLDRAELKNVETEVVYDGWPTNVSDLDNADTIVFLSDGMQWSPWSFTPERIAAIQKQIDRGCGFMSFHFATYIPYKFQEQGLAWNGGYVEYDGPKHREMYFTQKTLTADVLFPSPKHPVMNGVKPFHVRDEFYYKATFVDHGVTPLLRVPELPADPKVFPGPLAGPQEQVTVWAYDRPRAEGAKIAGRSIGATLGHFYDNWQNDDYRKFVLNAIVWTAQIKVPKDGVPSTYLDDAAVDRILGPTPAPVQSPLEPAKPPK
jgi:type 1 glutamine amidotransferase